MVKLVLSLLGMVGAASLRRMAWGLALVLLGALVLASAAGFGAVAVYQSLLARFEPWAAACLIAGVLALAGAGVCWLGSARLRRHPSLGELKSSLPSLEALSSLVGRHSRGGTSALQMVTLAALVGFALGRRR